MDPSTNQTGASPTDPNELFPQAVNCIFNRFTILKMAVEHDMGGPDSMEKAEWLYDTLLEYFDTNKELYPDDLEVWFEEIFEEEFNVELEDDRSFKDISLVLINLYRQLTAGNVEEVAAFVEQNKKFVKADFNFYKDPQQRAAAAAAAAAEPTAMDVDESADIMAGVTLDAQAQEPEQPAVDPDGWEVVTKKGKKRS